MGRVSGRMVNGGVWSALKMEEADPREDCRQPLENGKDETRDMLMDRGVGAGGGGTGHGKSWCPLEGFGCFKFPLQASCGIYRWQCTANKLV